jgi:hypothetical protein
MPASRKSSARRGEEDARISFIFMDKGWIVPSIES